MPLVKNCGEVYDTDKTISLDISKKKLSKLPDELNLFTNLVELDCSKMNLLV